MCCCNWWALDMVNTLLKYRVSYRHVTFMIETFERLMKSCEKKFDMCNCMFT